MLADNPISYNYCYPIYDHDQLEWLICRCNRVRQGSTHNVTISKVCKLH